jgi:predicted nucleic acid-binding protein
VIVCDTGPLVAAAIQDDTHHRECVDLFTALHLAGRRILVPGPVIAEVGYLLAREGGARVEAQFLTSLADGEFLAGGAHRRRLPALGRTRVDLPGPAVRNY